MNNNFDVSTDKNITSLTINSTLDMSVAEQLLETLTQALANNTDIDFDASKVERVSTACCQLVLSASQTATKNGHSFNIKKSSGKFGLAVKELGLLNMIMKAE